MVYELDEEINFTFKQNDILLNRKSGYRNLFIRDIISFFTGGHSALVIDEAGFETIEVFGYSDQFDYVKVYENDWIQNELEVIGVRTKAVELDYEQYRGALPAKLEMHEKYLRCEQWGATAYRRFSSKYCRW